MWHNYLKTSLRNLVKNRSFSLINILGLSVGIAAGLLILQYVSYEISYDTGFEHADRLYRLQLNRYQNGQLLMENAITNTAIGPALKRDLPEVDDFCRGGIEECLIYYQDVKINDQKVFWVDETFINLFPLTMKAGDPATALKDPYTAVLSESQAKIYFGDQDPLGKSVILNEGLHFLVTGVFEDLPSNSHLQLDVLMSMSTGYEMGWARPEGNWYSEWVYNYILLQPGADPAAVEAKLPELLARYRPDLKEKNMEDRYLLQPVTSIHLDSRLLNEISQNGSRSAVRAMTLIAILILVIAWINFINLSTAKSVQRAREVGIRKTIGAARVQLVGQYLLESLLINLVSLGMALILVLVLQPSFIRLTGKPVNLDLLLQPNIAWTVIGILLVGTLLSGLYPAFLLSSFQPVKVLKGKPGNHQKGLKLRQVLVIFQFAVSIALLIGTAVIVKQIRFMQQKELGANLDQVLVLHTPKTLNMDTTRYRWFNSFRAALDLRDGVRQVSASNVLPGEEIMYRTEDVRLIGGLQPTEVSYAMANISSQYLDCFGLTLLAGRNFKPDMDQDRAAIIINEKAMQALGIGQPESAIEQQVMMGPNQYRIVGVVADYHHEGLKKAIEPMIFRHWYNYLFGYYTIKLDSRHLPSTMEAIKSSWEEIFPIAPFDYFFLDQHFNLQYQADRQFSKIIGFFTLLAVVIACLGLFGLTSYATVQRTREIGIRKVNGATSGDIMLLFSKDFSRWMAIAFIVAVPVIYLLMQKWLSGYAYKTDISWWLYLAAGLLMLITALLTVSAQVIKAGRMNPVESIGK